MKKISALVVALIAVFSLTGCGTKNLTCTIVDDVSKASYVTTFKGNEITKIVFENTTQVDKDEVDEVYSDFEDDASIFDNQSGIKVTTTKGNDYVSLKLELEISKMDEELLEAMNMIEDYKNTSVEDFAKVMEEQGFTCK